MAQDPYSAEEQALFERELERKLRAELPNVREEEIKAAAHRAAERELELHREELREQLESEVEDTTLESPEELREEANREAPSKLLIGIILLIILLLLLAATNRLPGFGAAQDALGAADVRNAASEPLTGILGEAQATPISLDTQGAESDVNAQTGRGLPNAGGVDGLNTIPEGTPSVDPLFEQYYNENGGVRIFGYPISPPLTVNGRRIQWFERSRLEYWPENQPPYTVMPGLVGVEYTDGREFSKQVYFDCRPDFCYFPETSHAVGGPFLEFWQANGGLDIFGYPISEQIVEIEPGTNRYRVVQYFERARFELNNDPELIASGNQVQLGLLGRALYLNEERSTIVADPQPTPVPLP